MTGPARKILIVDDEEVIVEILRRRLERMGFEVSIAHDSTSAVMQIGKTGYDLVICDAVLQNGASGFEVLRAAKSSGRAVNFVAMSGYPETDDSVSALMESGASLFVKKPFSSLGGVAEKMASLASR